MGNYVARLRSLVQECTPRLLALGDARAAARPAPDKWSPLEVVGHLVDSASNNHVRFVQAQLQTSLVFPGYDQEAWVSIQRYQHQSWPEMVSLWRDFNLHIAHVMESASAETRVAPRSEHNLDVIAWKTVPADETTTLDDFMEDYVGHLEHHLEQVLGEDLGRGGDSAPAEARPALLIVDVQEDAVARRPHAVDRFLANVHKLLEACRSAGTAVVFAQHDGKPGEAEEPHTPGWEIHAGIAPLPDEPVFRKRFNSAFRGTGLDEHLRGRGIDTLVVVGIQTEYCVDTTIRVAFELGYTVVLPEMTNTTYDNGAVPAKDILEMFNTRIWDGRFGSVVPVEAALALVSSAQPR